MEAIGGYFELELPSNNGTVYHDDALDFNSGRNAFKYLLEILDIREIKIPFYICNAVIDTISEMGIEYEFYSLNKNLEIKNLDKYKDRTFLLYVNYFGLKNKYVKKLTGKFNNIIIDNSQAFFCRPENEGHAFYSPRKFFGVPDGGFAYCRQTEEYINLETDISKGRISHLLIRLERSAEKGYQEYKSNELKIRNLPVKKMSKFTGRVLNVINYEEVIKVRNENFDILHDALGNLNELSYLAEESRCLGPLIYPFLNINVKRQDLIDERIFVAKYWPEISQRISNENEIEYSLTEMMISLPIDQRYGKKEMEEIIEVISKHAK